MRMDLGRFWRMPAQRALLWGRILQQFQGCSPWDRLGLLLSAVDDTIAYTLAPKTRISPIAHFVTKVKVRGTTTIFHVRPGTDDLYDVLPKREGDVHDAILDSLREGDVLVDVGANVGYYTVLGSKRVGSSGKVVAIEPIPSTAELLRRNVAANSCRNVEIVELAVWNQPRVCLSIRVPSRLFGQASVSDGVAGTQLNEYICVNATTLDEICAPYSRIRVVKLDTEGSELEILMGAGSVLDKSDIVVVEASVRGLDIISLLRSKGFHVHKMRFSSYIMARKN